MPLSCRNATAEDSRTVLQSTPGSGMTAATQKRNSEGNRMAADECKLTSQPPGFVRSCAVLTRISALVNNANGLKMARTVGMS
ncbi:hypothetical protein M514_02810 [Trichuris suis]|uniref:Uncharacterized protein n=1 Tax=Trichuris suis TaxID=68888 RepID=A0A085MGK9_9BILA|nr:hypothetical protein M513_02810 [Trichuris suis]KFD63765.1 hypothetical protein M514_02810 [Trichuris suis]